MPFAENSDTPPDVRRRFSGHCLTVWREAWNDTFERHGDEGRAFATAEQAGIQCEDSKMDHSRKAFVPFDFKLSETGDVSVAFSRFGVIDSDNDVTYPGAMPVGKTVPVSAYGHTSWDGALPIGKGTIREVGDLGILDGRFFMDTDQGRNGYATVKAMADIQDWSFGYVVLPPSGPEVFEGKDVRALRKLDVFEVSPVLKGAGIGTATLAIKSGAPGPDAPYAEHLAWVLDEVKALTDRSRDRAVWRAKEGRVMSNANMERLRALHEAMRGAAEDLESMMAEMAPKASPVTLEILLATARRLGVTA